MKTAVINNREALVQGQLQPIGKDSNGMAMLGGVVTLVPGLNLVDSEQLAALRKNPTFALNFTAKIQPSLAPEQSPEKVGRPILELVMSPAGPSKDGKAAEPKPLEVENALPLAKLSEELCKLVIGETLVEGTLRQWAREEARPAVRYEIEQQIEKITKGTPAGPAAVGR